MFDFLIMDGKLPETIGNLLSKLQEGINAMTRLADEIAALRTNVTELTSTVASAKELIEGLAAKIEDNIGDETALQEIVTELRAQKDQLAAAVVANTPAEPPVEPTPPPAA